MTHLVVCEGCARHVRARETTCPFCGDTLSEALRASPPPRLPGRRLGRLATFTFGATLAATAAGCGGGEAEEPPQQEDTGGGEVALYGAPASPDPEGGTPPSDGATLPDQGSGPPDEGAVQPMYGVAPDQ